MAVTDLTGYTWVGNDVISGAGQFAKQEEIEGYCGTVNFGRGTGYSFSIPSSLESFLTYISTTTFGVNTYGFDLNYNKYGYYNNQDIFERVFVEDPQYRTVYFTGGTDATNPELITWLEANGTLTKKRGWQHA